MSFHSSYPLQQHAGKVGYGPNYSGPNYNPRASVFDKVRGRAQEVVGKVTRNLKLVNKGHDRHTGENKRRKAMQGKDPTMDSFTIAGNDPTTTTEGHPSDEIASSVSEPKSKPPNANSVRQSSEEASPQ